MIYREHLMRRPNTLPSLPQRPTRPARLVLFSVSLAVTLLVGACGSGSDTASTDTTSTVISAEPTTTAPTTTIDQATLPQTEERPVTSGDGFARRMEALADAIIADDSTRGLSSFFPVEAYKQVTKNTDPAADWKNRLVAEFGVDTHDAHKLLGPAASGATFLGADVPATAVWVKPGEEYNLIGYWRVYGTTLRFDVGGTVKVMPVSSLISWRGQWYVVHLGAIR